MLKTENYLLVNIALSVIKVIKTQQQLQIETSKAIAFDNNNNNDNF